MGVKLATRGAIIYGFIALSIVVIPLWIALYPSPPFRYCISQGGKWPATNNYTDQQPAPVILLSKQGAINLRSCAGGYAKQYFEEISAICALLVFLATAILAWIAWKQ